MKTLYRLTVTTLLTSLIILTGCGGGGGDGSLAGIGGTGKVASGTITGFGSIFVNGVEYDLTGASISVDDGSGTEGDLRIGMVVTVDGTVSGTTGSAASVVFDDDVEGPVSGLTSGPDGLTKTFMVLGTGVRIDASGTAFDDGNPGFSFDTIANDDVVEISGFFDGTGVLNATYIEKTDDLMLGSSTVELKGIVSNAGTGAGVGDSFTINNITVNILAGSLSDVPGGVVTNGLFVEAEGIIADATTIDASRIELEDGGIGEDGDEVSLQGLVSGFTDLQSNFFVGSQEVDASSASLEPTGLQLTNAMNVEVEGELSGNVLLADEVESRGREIKIHASVNTLSVSNMTTNEGSITLNIGDGTITVATNSQTSFEDETGADTTPPLKLGEINSGDFLEISGFLDAGGNVVSSEVHRESADTVILQGPVDSADQSAPSITILGVTFFTDGSTEFEGTDDNPLPGGANDFYSSVAADDMVKIEDNAPGDGTADEVDQES